MKKLLQILCAPALLCAGALVTADVAEAQSFRIRVGRTQFSYGRSYDYGFSRGRSCYDRGRRLYSGPVYHAPSVHYDRVYHHDYTHWTPGRGLHSHGHYHTVPHVVPGHYDYWHGDHLHTNPRFHHYGH